MMAYHFDTRMSFILWLASFLYPRYVVLYCVYIVPKKVAETLLPGSCAKLIVHLLCLLEDGIVIVVSRIVRDEVPAPVSRLVVRDGLVHRYPKPHSCPSRDSPIRVVCWHHVSELVGRHVVKVHRYLIAPHSVAVYYPVSLDLKFLYLSVISLSYHFDGPFSRHQLLHVTLMLER